jgi:hypothetical protein
MFMSKATVVALCRAGVLASVVGWALVGCQKDEPPPPLPAPKPVEAIAEAPLELKPEDAGRPAAPPVEKPKGTGVKASGLKACCAALRQNATSAPEPTKGYMLYAAGMCDMAATQGKDKASAVGMLQTALKGAGLPADCK